MIQARRFAKRVLGELPFTAEIYQRLNQEDGSPPGGYSLARLESAVPSWKAAALEARKKSTQQDQTRILVVGYLKWWLEYAVALGLLFSGMGHQVDLGFIPLRGWKDSITKFDLRRNQQYLQSRLNQLHPLVKVVDLSRATSDSLPSELDRAIEALSLTDSQYTFLSEDLNLIDEEGEFYRWRLARNRATAKAARTLFLSERYDSVIIPNGSILEFGAVYNTAVSMGIPTVTFEFGEQRERMWLAQNEEVMRQDTSQLWEILAEVPISPVETDELMALCKARRGGQDWTRFSRRWQVSQGEGVQATREMLGLNADLPIVLLCTNVVGDSLALGRQVWSRGMADWLNRTVESFSHRPEAQLVVRVHPGEMQGVGQPSADIVRETLSTAMENIHIVLPDSKINTYDLIDLAGLGLVYTTTVGLEMAMTGLPVIVAGKTHYRRKGFTQDPSTWEEYQKLIDDALLDPNKLQMSEGQVELATRYAYRFFFQYPFPFPWHLVSFWDDIASRPFEDIVQPEGRAPFNVTLDALRSVPIDWRARLEGIGEGEVSVGS